MNTAELVFRAVNLFFVALVVGAAVLVHSSVVPIFRDWPAELSLRLHKEMVRVNPDRYVKPSAVISLVAAIAALAVDDGPTSALVLTILGMVLLLLVAVISEAINQPINRRIGRADTVPPDYAEMRRRWDSWNLLRTAIALVGFVCYIVGALEAV